MENTSEQIIEHDLHADIPSENELPSTVIPPASKTETESLPDMPNVEQLEIARLSSILTVKTSEIAELNTRLIAYQQHYESLLIRQREENSREKQTTVMRYAESEKAKLDSDKRCELLTTKNNELLKERENHQIKLAEYKLMNSKLQQAYEGKLAEIFTHKKEAEKLKELNQSMDASLKSTLTHLKGETIQLKEQRELVERLKKELHEQRTVNEQLQIQCKELTETAKAIPTDDERTQAFDTLLSEYNVLKMKLTNIQEENDVLRVQIKSADEDRLALENVIESFRSNALREKEATKKLYDDLLAAREQDSIELSKLKQAEQIYHQTLIDNVDLRQLLAKEHEHLELTQKLTETNSILQSEREQLDRINQQLTIESKELQIKYDEQMKKMSEIEEREKSTRESFVQLNGKYEGLMKIYEQTLKQWDDAQVEMQALKKKHQANTKDLIKQLQQLQKTKTTTTNGDNLSPAILTTSQTRSTRSKENGADGISSRGSPTSSCCSLNEVHTSLPPPSPDQLPAQPPPLLGSTQIHHQNPPDDEQDVIVNIVDIDRQKLIDKLLKQQRALVRRNEKIEFLNDHIQLLTQDLQNKRRIIQSYAMNEDGFMYTSNEADLAKQQLANKSRHNSSSLMATLYNRATAAATTTSTSKFLPQMFQDQSSPMTLETALDIMGKLQSVLEDTLSKNITLKENVDTLSKEIDRLSGRITK